MHTAPLRIGIIGFDGITALDLVGPLESFANAARQGAAEDGNRAAYEVVVLGLTKAPFTAWSGVTFCPQYGLAAAPALDTLILPGGEGLRRPETNAIVAAWVGAHAGGFRRIATVCTGIYGLAPTGLLDGRRVTTHWRHALDVARRFPRLRVDSDPIFIKDGSFYTSGGITAGIDLSLALIEEDYGRGSALSVAREMVVYMKRPGSQAQFSEPLRFQSRTNDRFADLALWIATHLDEELGVERLADRACLSLRQFRRRFRESLGQNPAAYVEMQRLDAALARLTGTGSGIEAVALSVGFKSADAFRRVFEKRFGLAPTAYRNRFSSCGGGPGGEQ
jgi:transcriptional regulator GlxA family with amidase domain